MWPWFIRKENDFSMQTSNYKNYRCKKSHKSEKFNILLKNFSKFQTNCNFSTLKNQINLQTLRKAVVVGIYEIES